jgi:hypothetical protein
MKSAIVLLFGIASAAVHLDSPVQLVQTQPPQIIQARILQPTDHIQYLVVPREQKTTVSTSTLTKVHHQTGGTMNCRVNTHTINMTEISPGRFDLKQQQTIECHPAPIL